MTAEQERERCLKLINNAIKYHQYDLRVVEVLKKLRKRVRSTGAGGGLSTEQQAMRCDNSTANPN